MNSRQLIALWRGRDNRYRSRSANGRPSSLTRDEAASVVAYRWSEVADLTIAEQRVAAAVLRAWTAPRVTT
jgi:hypothetical protein